MSAHTFRIGEPALVRDAPNLPIHALPYVGTVVTVRSKLIEHGLITGSYCYQVECFDGVLAWAAPELLQKLPPAPPDWKSMALRDDLVRDEKRPARVPHPAIAGVTP